jgi:hypothetical protein
LQRRSVIPLRVRGAMEAEAEAAAEKEEEEEEEMAATVALGVEVAEGAGGRVWPLTTLRRSAVMVGGCGEEVVAVLVWMVGIGMPLRSGLFVDFGVGVAIAVERVVLVGDCERKVTTGGMASTWARYWSMGMMAP